jgi:hypothetical protein
MKSLSKEQMSTISESFIEFIKYVVEETDEDLVSHAIGIDADRKYYDLSVMLEGPNLYELEKKLEEVAKAYNIVGYLLSANYITTKHPQTRKAEEWIEVSVSVLSNGLVLTKRFKLTKDKGKRKLQNITEDSGWFDHEMIEGFRQKSTTVIAEEIDLVKEVYKVKHSYNLGKLQILKIGKIPFTEDVKEEN